MSPGDNPFSAPQAPQESGVVVSNELQRRMRTERLDLSELLGLASWAFRDQLTVYLLQLVAFYLPMQVLAHYSRLSMGAMDLGIGFSLSIANMVLAMLASGATTLAAGSTIEGHPLSFGDSLAGSLKRFLPLLGTALLAGLFTVLWAFALLLPAIWAATRYAFITQTVMLHGESGSDAIERSKELVEGHWWETFGVYVAMVMVGVVVEQGLGIVSRAVTLPDVVMIIAKTGSSVISIYLFIVLTAMYLNRRYLKVGA